MRLPALLFAAALALPSHAEIPTVRVDKVEKDGAGGSFTVCAIGTIQGKRWFLKSNRGSPRGTRYANFESDILAGQLFERLGLKAPRCFVARLAQGSPLRAQLGDVVLAMELVDAGFAKSPVRHGHFPGKANADVRAFLRMLLVDVLIGNGDRRGANYFVAGPEGELFPIPIDNNCGFSTLVAWSVPASTINFLPTYSGLGDKEIFKDMGTIRNVLLDAEDHRRLLADPALVERLRAEVPLVVAALDDAFLAGIVEALPPEILPADLSIDPRPKDWPWRDYLDEAQLAMLHEGLERGGTLTSITGRKTRMGAGEHLFGLHKTWARDVLRWRRDHLGEALDDYLAWRAGDPATREQERWHREDEPRVLPPLRPKPAGSSGWAH